MSKEQLNELAEALNILTAKSSIVKERDELRAILEDNLLSEQVSRCFLVSLLCARQAISCLVICSVMPDVADDLIGV